MKACSARYDHYEVESHVRRSCCYCASAGHPTADGKYGRWQYAIAKSVAYLNKLIAAGVT
jgi:hypothetical protein